MKVGIITYMTCMFAVSLTVGGPIKSQASKSEKTVLIGGNVTLLCPFVPDVTWQWVYWKKNDDTIYSLEFRSNTPWTNDTRYESSNHATMLTIKDLKKTDSGLYHCKVATLATTDIIKEGGQVLLSVTDQEVVLSTISPVVPCRAFTTIPPQPAEDKAIFLAFLIVIPIIFTMCFGYMYWKRIKNLPAEFVSAFRRLASRCTSTPLATDSRDETSENGGKLPLVGPVLIDDLHCASACNTTSVVKRMRQVLHTLVEKYEDKGVTPKDGKYSAPLRKYVSSRNRCVPIGVLDDVEYFLDELDHIPVGRKRDVCEIMLIMPENQEVDRSMTYSNIFLEYDHDDSKSAVKREHSSRTKTLEGQMRSILSRSETRDAARSYISLIILDAPVDKSGSASLSQQATSRYNQAVNQTKQETSFLLRRDEDSKREEDNLIGFWLSKVIKLDPAVQRRVSDRFDEFDQEVDSSTKEQAMGRRDMQNTDAKEFKNIKLNESIDQEKGMGRRDMQNADAKELQKINLNESTDQEPQPLKSLWPLEKYMDLLSREQLLIVLQESCAQTSNNQLMDIIERTAKKEIRDKDEEKAMGHPDMQSDDSMQAKDTHFTEINNLNK